MKYLLFSGKHCKNCPTMKKNLDTIGIKYEEISTDEPKGTMMSGVYHVRALPTLVITRGGKPIESFPGVRPLDELEKIKKKYKWPPVT
jgi:thioredoxin-like negative regulator of GroEL